MISVLSNISNMIIYFINDIPKYTSTNSSFISYVINLHFLTYGFEERERLFCFAIVHSLSFMEQSQTVKEFVDGISGLMDGKDDCSSMAG